MNNLGAESDDESIEGADVKQMDESNNKMEGEEFPRKLNIIAGDNGSGNQDDALFSVPLLPALPLGAKSKAKLSSNDGFSSTESSQGITMHLSPCDTLTNTYLQFEARTNHLPWVPAYAEKCLTFKISKNQTRI